jgi:mannosyltransferase OCH1-like enzyme
MPAGVYADLDFEALRDLGPLLKGQQVVLAAMTDELAYDQSIPNAWLASVERHPFWLFAIARIIALAATARDLPDKCAQA